MTTLSDAQFRLLSATAAKGDTHIRRSPAASDATLRSLAAKGYATLEYTAVGARQVVTAARITGYGWLTWTAEADRRDAARDAEARARITRPAADPFAAVINSADYRRSAAIDAAFSI